MHEKETIQHEIGSALKSTKRPFVRLQVAISEKFRNKLNRKYALNYSWFKACPYFLTDLGVIAEDIYSETDNIEKNEINFETKVVNRKTIFYNENKKSVETAKGGFEHIKSKFYKMKKKKFSFQKCSIILV